MDHSIFDFRFHCAVVLTGLMLLPAALLPAASAQTDDSKAKAIGIAAAVEALPAGVRPPGRYALVIGADAYTDTRIPGLPACGNDARTLAAVLTDPQTGMVPKENLRLLVGGDVTKEKVIDALDNLGRKAGRDDLVIVFFSGHGATDERGRAYWIMSGTKADKLRATALPETDVSELLGEIHATRLVTFIDACYSAATANVTQTKSLLDLSKLYPDFKGDGRVAITASKGDQLSMVISNREDPGFGYSAFAWHLIEGLKGKADTQGLTAQAGDSSTADGVVTVDELWTYVKDRAEHTSRGMGGNQQPQIKGQLGSRFLLTVNSSRMLEIEREREARTNKTAERLAALRKLFVDERINAGQFTQGKNLLTALPAELDETQQKQRKVYEDLVDGRIPAGYLTALLDAVETPQQREARLAREAQIAREAQAARESQSANEPARQTAIARQVDVLRLIWTDAESKSLGSDERKQYLREFLNKSQWVRTSTDNHPALVELWTLRALAALELDQSREAWEAGDAMRPLKLDQTDNELVRKTLAMLERKGLLNKESSLPKRFANERASLKLAEAKANPKDFLEAEQILSQLVAQSPDYQDALALRKRVAPWVQAHQQAQAERARQAEAQRLQREQEAAQRRAEEARRLMENLQRQPHHFDFSNAAKPTAEAKQAQQAAAEAYKTPISITNSIGMKLMLIPTGTFMMGSPANEPERGSNEKQFKVIITQPFHIASTEVTQSQWKAVMGNNPSYFKGDNLPVEQVSWDDAVAFCKALSKKEGRTYQLPTEAQWEFACRAGTTTAFNWGTNSITTNQANYNGKYVYNNGRKGKYREKATNVGDFQSNAWGLFDMHGNLWEWCLDWYGGYSYPASLVSNPIGPNTGEDRVLRGGSLYGNPGYCRSANRDLRSPGHRHNLIGFRVVLASVSAPGL